ncbi:hypothetical protein JCM3765_003124 [Sporobolomyces pararoseus]
MQRFRRNRSESKKRNNKEEGSRTTTSRASSTISRTPSTHSTSTSTSESATPGVGVGMSRSTSQSSSLSLLPEPEDFRTSLILPHLTARFELLRGNDGQLVDLETLTTHLDEQRKTGRLTRFEMDSVLQQYKLQQGLEANRHPLPISTSTSTIGAPGGGGKKKKKRIDWSGIDLEKLSKEQQQQQQTFSQLSSPPPPQLPQISTTSTSQSQRPSSNSFLSLPHSFNNSEGGVGGSPTSSLNSFMSFLPETSSPGGSPQITTGTQSNSSSPNLSTSIPGSPNTNYLPRRGRNEGSLFGSRVGGRSGSGSSSTGMVKSLSGGSLASNKSGSNSRRSKKRGIVSIPNQEEQEEAEISSEHEKGKGKQLIDEERGSTRASGDDEKDRQEEEEGLPTSSSKELNLTKSQIKRISTALDTLQVELSKTLSTGLRGGGGEGGLKGILSTEEEEEEDFKSRFKDQDEEEQQLGPTTETQYSLDQPDGSFSPPPVDDTKPIEPSYNSISQSSQQQQQVPVEQASQVPLPPSSSVSSSLNSIAQSSNTSVAQEKEEEESPPFLPSYSLPDHTRLEPNPFLPLQSEEPIEESHSPSSSSPQRMRQYTSETDTTETPSTPNGTTSTGTFPQAFSVFPFVPTREEFPTTTPKTNQVEIEEEEEEGEQGDETLMAIDAHEDPVVKRDSKEEEEEERDLSKVAALASSIPLPVSTSNSINSISELITSSAAPQSTPPSLQRQSQQRDSSISNSSSSSSTTGSSFHEALESVSSPTLSHRGLININQHQYRQEEEDDDEIQLPDSSEGVGIRESKLLEELPPPTAGPPLVSIASSQSSTNVDANDQKEDEDEEEEGTRLLSNLDRLPSSELIALASSSSFSSAANNNEGGGDAAEDIALEDLVLIQQALVRRAEEKKKRLELMRGVDIREQDSMVEGEEEEDEMVESIRESELAGREFRNPIEEDGDELIDSDENEDEEEDDVSSSRGMGSRKDSAESGITSTGAFDFGDELSLSGLGLTSLSSRRASKRRSETTRIDTTMASSTFLGGGPQSSRMELQTSQSSSSPGFTNSAITPSTTQSDAFEFSSLAGSPDTASWIEQRDEHDHDEEAEQEDEEEKEGPLGFSRSPGMHDLSIDHDTLEGKDILGDSPDLPQEDEEQHETEDQVGELPSSSETTEPAPSTSSSLGAPVQIEGEDNLSALRVPRNMPRRDPASTTSMLIRDVRNQATLATFALKKTPTSPPSRSLTKKSIRKVSISSPHLVSAPVDMATVPIVPSPNLNDDNSPSSSRSPRSNNSKVSRSKTRGGKDGIEGIEGSKSRGLGSRFKSLLKKQSRDHLSLNGDEITPFVDRPSTDRISHPIPILTSTSTSGPPPVTPPNQDIARFSSTPGSAGPHTPTNLAEDPTTPLAKVPISSIRSPPRRPPPPSLDVVEELVERSSPPTIPTASINNNSIVPPSPALSTQSGRESRTGGLNRFVSRLRKSPVPPTTPPRHEESIQGASSGKTSFDTTESRVSMREQPPLGLGIDNGESISSTRESYDRSPSIDDDGSQFPPPVFVARTAPLSVGRNSQQGFTFPPHPESASSSASGSGGTRHSRGGSESVTRTSGHPVRASIDSMQRLWEAAEDLGLPPDKVQELVDSAYAQSPTTSPIRSGSMSSSFGNRSNSTNSPRRQRSNASQSRRGGSSTSHTRHTSETPSSHRRKGSNASSKSVQDRVPTPPPGSRHHRKASLASSREAGPVPDRPTSSYLPPSSSAGSRLSVSGSQYPPPASPSLGSIISSRQSGYADSFLDFYAQASDDYDSEIPPVPPLRSQHASDRSLASNSGDYADRTLRADGTGQGQEGEEEEEEDQDEVGGEVVWQVLSDLRNNRLSTISKDSSFGFDSRDSSFEVEHGASEGNNSTDRSESIANMLRHRDRKRSSASMPPFQAGRFPSIYVRDEQKLLDLGQHGGVATEQQGHFFVRPKDASDESQQPPPLPDEYRQLIASASFRHEPITQPPQDNQI